MNTVYYCIRELPTNASVYAAPCMCYMTHSHVCVSAYTCVCVCVCFIHMCDIVNTHVYMCASFLRVTLEIHLWAALVLILLWGGFGS